MVGGSAVAEWAVGMRVWAMEEAVAWAEERVAVAEDL